MPIIKNYQPEWTKHLADKEESLKIRTQLIVWMNIYHWRKYKGLSQEELAKGASITQSIVSELEDGDYNPTVDVLNRIANALNIKIDLLTKENFNRKFFESLDYFVSKIKGIDILKLMKLMFFTDYDALNIYWQKLTWIDYYRWYAGPFNNNIYIANDVFEKKNTEFENKQNLKKRVALTKDDEKFLDKMIEKYWKLSSTEIRDLSYKTEPMKGCTKTNEYKMWDKVF